MHRFIIYQYGKVGSTSLVEALNKLPDTEAYQSHFLGEAAFADTLTRLMNPEESDYFFRHSCGQLTENLRIYRHYLRRDLDDNPLTVITMARQPFDWFRSCVAQDIDQHLHSLKLMLDKRHISYKSNGAAIKSGMALVFQQLLLAIAHFGSLDQMCRGERYPELEEALPHEDQEDFQSLMFFVNMFMRPHLWFQTHFEPFLGFGLKDLAPMDSGPYKKTEQWGNIYLLKYEQLSDSMRVVMNDLGYRRRAKLPRRNTGRTKHFARELKGAFNTEAATQLRALCHSEDTRLLGYN